MSNAISNPATDADGVAIPITSHALTRQAKRAQKALQALLDNPPPKAKLSHAQSLLAEIWGRSAYDRIVASDAAPDAAIPAPAVHESLFRQTSSRADNAGLWQRLGPVRSAQLIQMFVTESLASQPDHLRGFCEALVQLEFCRARCQAEPHLARLYAAKMEVGAPHPLLSHAKPFSARAFTEWFDLTNLEQIAWGERRAAYGASVDIDLVGDDQLRETLADLLRDLPGYDRHKFGRRGGQGDDTQFYFGTAVRRPLRPALMDLCRLDETNPVLWDSDWEAAVSRDPTLQRSLLSEWPLWQESWLAPTPSDLTDWLLQQSHRCGGQYCAVDALELVSYGALSSEAKRLKHWLSRPALLQEMAQSLSQFMQAELADMFTVAEIDPALRPLALYCRRVLHNNTDPTGKYAAWVIGRELENKFPEPNAPITPEDSAKQRALLKYVQHLAIDARVDVSEAIAKLHQRSGATVMLSPPSPNGKRKGRLTAP